jgi:hypothetical protein
MIRPRLSCCAVLQYIPAWFVSYPATTTPSDGGGMERVGPMIVTSPLQAKLLNRRFHDLSVLLQILCTWGKGDSTLIFVFQLNSMALSAMRAGLVEMVVGWRWGLLLLLFGFCCFPLIKIQKRLNLKISNSCVFCWYAHTPPTKNQCPHIYGCHLV